MLKLAELSEDDFLPSIQTPARGAGVDAEMPTLADCLAAGANGVEITNAHYHALPGISGSHYPLLAESNRHFDNRHLFALGDTPALTFGTLFHTLVLEPDTVESCYTVLPAFNGRTNEGKAAKAAFIEANQHKTLVDQDTFKIANAMARNVRAICGEVIEAGIKERSLFVEIDKMVLKSRLDIDLEAVGDDYDLKSISLGVKDFSDSVLARHIKKLKYHWSAAHRNIVRRALGLPVQHSYLIFCNTGPGHMVRVIRIAPDWIKDAEIEVAALLAKRREYLIWHDDIDAVEIDDLARHQSQ